MAPTGSPSPCWAEVALSPTKPVSPARGTPPTRRCPAGAGAWIVTSVLEVRERPMLDEGALEILLAEDVVVLFANIQTLHSTLHVGLPVSIRW